MPVLFVLSRLMDTVDQWGTLFPIVVLIGGGGVPRHIPRDHNLLAPVLVLRSCGRWGWRRHAPVVLGAWQLLRAAQEGQGELRNWGGERHWDSNRAGRERLPWAEVRVEGAVPCRQRTGHRLRRPGLDLHPGGGEVQGGDEASARGGGGDCGVSPSPLMASCNDSGAGPCAGNNGGGSKVKGEEGEFKMVGRESSGTTLIARDMPAWGLYVQLDDKDSLGSASCTTTRSGRNVSCGCIMKYCDESIRLDIQTLVTLLRCPLVLFCILQGVPGYIPW